MLFSVVDKSEYTGSSRISAYSSVNALFLTDTCFLCYYMFTIHSNKLAG